MLRGPFLLLPLRKEVAFNLPRIHLSPVLLVHGLIDHFFKFLLQTKEAVAHNFPRHGVVTALVRNSTLLAVLKAARAFQTLEIALALLETVEEAERLQVGILWRPEDRGPQ